MSARVAYVAWNTFREAVRDRVLYNLIFFALLLVGASLLFGQISIGISKIVLVNLGLTAISLFGIVIAIFIGIGLVSKEIEKKTLYTILSRPVRRWEFIVGKFGGLAWTLIVNTACMAIGFFVALLALTHSFARTDAYLLVAIYFIVLEFVVVTAITLLFSSFSSPVLSAVFTLALFVIGTFSEDLRGFAAMSDLATRVLATIVAYIVPNFASLNVISQVAHDLPISSSLILYNTAYSVLYSAAAIAGAVLIFERRNLK
jgi:ABC-type transport system involved in multi-copper enzyme maturation permease subunit